MPLSQKALKELAAATELLKEQIDIARQVMTEKHITHEDVNVITTAQILATNLLSIFTSAIAIRPLK